MARDLSASGISFQSRSSFAIGERVVVQLRSPHGLNSAVGRVVRSMRGGEGVLPHFTAVAFDVPHLDLAA